MKICKVEGCNCKVHAKELCNYHYKKSRQTLEKKLKQREYDNKYRKSKKGRENSKKNKNIRRAVKNGAGVVETFSYEKLFNEHYYVCCICGLPIDSSLRYPDFLSVSLEHKVPLSKGGWHSKENCAPSHILCNLRKGAKIIEGSFEGANI